MLVVVAAEQLPGKTKEEDSLPPSTEVRIGAFIAVMCIVALVNPFSSVSNNVQVLAVSD